MALSALVPLLFFTASSNIIWTYVLPAAPGLAWWAARWMGRHPQQGLRWALGGVVLAVVAWVSLAWVTQVNGRLERSSAKGLVAACDEAWQRLGPAPAAHSNPSAPRLILLGRRSFSAHFYTQGKTLRVDDLGAVGAGWPEAGTCLAVKLDDPLSLAAAQAGARLVEDLGVHHERRLWWAQPPNTQQARP